MPVRWVDVQSSNIRAIGYDSDNAVLGVIFRGEGQYAYNAVPVEVFETLIASPSVGQAFFQLVRGRYAYQKVGLSPAGGSPSAH